MWVTVERCPRIEVNERGTLNHYWRYAEEVA